MTSRKREVWVCTQTSQDLKNHTTQLDLKNHTIIFFGNDLPPLWENGDTHRPTISSLRKGWWGLPPCESQSFYLCRPAQITPGLWSPHTAFVLKSKQRWWRSQVPSPHILLRPPFTLFLALWAPCLLSYQRTQPLMFPNHQCSKMKASRHDTPILTS